MKISNYKIPLVSILIAGFLVTILPKYSIAVVLTLQEAIEMALKNNPEFETEQIEMNIRTSEITKSRSQYIPNLVLQQSSGYSKDQPDTEGLKVDSEKYSISITQKVPFGGEISISDIYKKNSYSSYNAEITYYALNGSTIESYTGNTAVADENEYSRQSVLTYKQPLLSGGLFGPPLVEIQRAKLAESVQKRSLINVRAQLIRKVTSAFFETMRQRDILSIHEEGERISEKLSNLIQSRFKMGLMSEQEVMLSAIELNKAKAEVLSTLHRLNTTINELQSLLAIEEEIKISDRGNKKSSHLEIEKAIASQTELSSLIKSVISLALENNPQLQMIQAQVEQQNFNVFIAQNQLLPTLDFTAQYGKNGQGESFDEASDMKGESYQIGLTFSYPFYNRYLTESYYQQRKNLEKIRRRLCDTKTEISNLVTMLIKQLDLLEKRRKNDENQIRIMETFFDYSIKALEKGLITQDKVFLARDDLLKTKTRYRDILIERHKTWANLESLL